MANRRHHTEIEWTHPLGFVGETWNPTSGCTKVSPACAHCYAEKMSLRFKLAPAFTPKEHKIILHPERLETPLHWSLPRCVFVDSMSDLFHEDIPFEFIDRCFLTMALTQRHLYQILTKRPERMRAYFHSVPERRILIDERWPLDDICKWPLSNVWLGVSAENQFWANARIPILLQIPSALHFVSIEPQLGPIDLTEITHKFSRDLLDELSALKDVKVEINALTGAWFDGWDRGHERHLGWIIAGGESGPMCRLSHPSWFRQIRDACQDAGIPFFFKQWGNYAPVQEAVPMEQVDFKVRYARYHPGRILNETRPSSPTDVPMRRMTKKKAGALLDGREWREYPDLSYFRMAARIAEQAS